MSSDIKPNILGTLNDCVDTLASHGKFSNSTQQTYCNDFGGYFVAMNMVGSKTIKSTPPITLNYSNSRVPYKPCGSVIMHQSLG